MHEEEKAPAELNLLMTHADDGSPVIEEGVRGETLSAFGVSKQKLDGFKFRDPGAAGNDLYEQGWCVIAPEGRRGDEILEALTPLIAHRAAETEDFQPQIFRVPTSMSYEEAAAWRQAHYIDTGTRDQRYFQLFVGDLHEMPLILQELQTPDGAVGRLAFDDVADYAAYAEKVVASETGPAPAENPGTKFYSVRDGSGATRAGYSRLMKPVLALAEKRGDTRFVATEDARPSADHLREVAAAAAGQMFFTMSHGDGAPRRGWKSVSEQRALQGALSFGRLGPSLTAEAVKRGPFVPGGLWFMFACFGAGTPKRTKFKHWLEDLKKRGQFRGRPETVLASLPKAEEPGFIAALPKAALANPRGPLAFIGHLDLAWTYGFMEIREGKAASRHQKFESLVRAALNSDRAAISMLEFTRYYNEINKELTTLYDLAEARAGLGDDPASLKNIGHTWMIRQDLAGYMLLGDPAARIRHSKVPQLERTRDAIDLGALHIEADRDKWKASENVTPAERPNEPTQQQAATPEQAQSQESFAVSPAADGPAQQQASQAPITADVPLQQPTPPSVIEPHEVPAPEVTATPQDIPAAPEGAEQPFEASPTTTKIEIPRTGEVEGEIESGGFELRWRLRWKIDR